MAKITLAEARDSGAVAIRIYCDGAPAAAGGCSHSGLMGIDAAIARWGGERPLDRLPLVCSQCGARRIDVRPDFGPRTIGGLPIEPPKKPG